MKHSRHFLFALPYTVLSSQDTVRMVAGEDHRYTLTAPGIERWLPGFLSRLDGKRTLEQALDQLPQETRSEAQKLVERLYSERILMDGTAADAHPATGYRPLFGGQGQLLDKVREGLASCQDEARPVLRVLCQDRLDYAQALRFGRECRQSHVPCLWVTSGPMNRGYVSPPFLPDAGPCLCCLVRHFQRLSPVPEIYDELIRHSENGRSIEPVPFPMEGVEILAQIVRWKLSVMGQTNPPPALYRLHVFEVGAMEVSTYRVLIDPECPDCGGGRQ